MELRALRTSKTKILHVYDSFQVLPYEISWQIRKDIHDHIHIFRRKNYRVDKIMGEPERLEPEHKQARISGFLSRIDQVSKIGGGGQKVFRLTWKTV